HCLQMNDSRETGEDFEIEKLKSNNYDLILMDYKLADDHTGYEVASAIREHKISTDILFYSSDVDKMRNAIFNPSAPLEGIYYSPRKNEEFESKVEIVIDKIVRRSEDLINLRGFVLDNSCDFEVRVKEILNKAWEKFEKMEKDELEKEAKKRLKNKVKSHKKTVDNLNEKIHVFPRAAEMEYFFDHHDRLILLTKTIKILQKEHSFQPQSKHLKFTEEYQDNILKYRNALGHKKSCDNTITIKGESVTIDDGFHKKMRRSLAEYDKLIKDIEEHIEKM
ncbi:MAG: response regulator, partial [Firmicutes bacterium]|nr:response regulator [Bacillota bacterium]